MHTIKSNMHSFAERLATAMGRERMTVTAFAAAMKKVDAYLKKKNPHEGVPHSVRAILNYLHGDREPTGALFFKWAGDVLQVRGDWLRTGEGEMTDATPVLTTLTAFAPATVIGQRHPTEPQYTVERLTRIAPALADFPAGLALFADVWNRYVHASPTMPGSEQQFKLAEQLWSQVIAPLGFFCVAAAAAPKHYYISMLSALLVAIPTTGKGRDVSRTPRKNAKQVGAGSGGTTGQVHLGAVFTVTGQATPANILKAKPSSRRKS